MNLVWVNRWNGGWNRITHVEECCFSRQIELDEAGWGSDLDTCSAALDLHKRVHREVAQFRRDVEQCVGEKRTLTGDDRALYMEYLSKVEIGYAHLSVSSFNHC